MSAGGRRYADKYNHRARFLSDEIRYDVTPRPISLAYSARTADERTRFVNLVDSHRSEVQAKGGWPLLADRIWVPTDRP